MRYRILLISILVFNSFKLFPENNLSVLVEKCKPAIFSITTYDEEDKPLAYATGFFIDTKGIGLTNYHVFEGAYKAIIKTTDGNKYFVNNILSQSKKMDIIKFSIANPANYIFQSLKIAQNKPKEGEPIFLIGNPKGLEYSVSNGIVSSIRNDENYGNIIQTTAPISSGSSGSPLMNLNGEIIGIISFTVIEGQNLNFAMSIADIYFLDEVNNLKFPEKPQISTAVEKTFKRFDWGTSSSDVLAKETLTFSSKDKGIVSGEYLINYLGSLVQVDFKITYFFTYDNLNSILIQPIRYLNNGVKEKFVLPTSLDIAHSEFMTFEKRLINLLGNNFTENIGKYHVEQYDLKKSLGFLTVTDDFFKTKNNLLFAKENIEKKVNPEDKEKIPSFFIIHKWINTLNYSSYELQLDMFNNEWDWVLRIHPLQK